MVSFHKLIDLAIGTSDSEFVNKKWLHILLHLIVKNSKLNSAEVNVLNGNLPEEQTCSLKLEDYQVTSPTGQNPNLPCSDLESSHQNLTVGINEITTSFSEIIPRHDGHTSLKDMYHKLNVFKRLEALESGILNMAGLIKEMNCMMELYKEKLGQIGTEMQKINSEDENLRRLSESLNEISLKETRTIQSINSETERIIAEVRNSIEEIDPQEIHSIRKSTFRNSQNPVNSDYSQKVNIVDPPQIFVSSPSVRNSRKSSPGSKAPAPSVTSSSMSVHTKAKSLVTDTLETAAQIISESSQEDTISQNRKSSYKTRHSCNLREQIETIESEILGHLKQNEFSLFEESLNNLKLELHEKIQTTETSYTQQNSEFEQKIKNVNEQLTEFIDNITKIIKKFETTLEVKVDNSSLEELKNLIENEVENLEERIKSLDCQVPIAAGACRKIKELNCISCTQKVIQLDCVVPGSSPINYRKSSNKQQSTKPKVIQKTHYLSLPTRYCGGSHTVTGPIKPCL